MLFATNGKWIKEYTSAIPFAGFVGVSGIIMNANLLVVMLGGHWGVVNLKGETVVLIDWDDYFGIYPEPDGGRRMHALTGNRFMDNIHSDGDLLLFDLYDGKPNLIASELHGWPSGICGEFIVTTEHIGVSESGVSLTVYTYTLEGESIASRVWDVDRNVYAEAFGDYVMVYTGADTLICDRELNILHVVPNKYDTEYDVYAHTYTASPNVLFTTDAQNLFHRTYLPDGTRLVTWADSSISD